MPEPRTNLSTDAPAARDGQRQASGRGDIDDDKVELMRRGPVEDEGRLSASTVEHLAAEAGTPLFLLDLHEIRKQARAFAAAFPDVRPFYSTKTNPHPAVIDLLASLGFGFDAATIGEIALLRERGISGDRILFTHPVKSAAEIAAAAQSGVRRYVFDSAEELRALAGRCPDATFLLRLAVEQSHSTYDYRGRFGVPGDEARALLRDAARAGLPVGGLTFHVGSQTLSTAAWSGAVRLAADLIDEFAADFPRLDMLNIGSGFPVDYDGAGAISFADVAGVVNRELGHLAGRITLVAEPGRALVARAVTLVSRVQRIRARGSAPPWVLLDASVYQGLIEILESAGRLRYRVEALSGQTGRVCMVGGKTLDPDDVFTDDADLPLDLADGDIVLVRDVGAYTLPFVARYHELPAPGVVCIDSADDARVMLARSTRAGLGVRSRVVIARGEHVFSVFGHRSDVRTRHTFEVGDGMHVEPTVFGRYLNHSCQPNAGVRTRPDGFLEVIARRSILPGEEVTVDYAMFETQVSDETGGPCPCSASQCRGVIAGFEALPDDLRLAYAGWTAAHLEGAACAAR